MCEPNFSDPSSFLYLDMLADILMRDALELESDFNTKMEFIKEQEQMCLDNAKNVFSVDQFLGSVNCCMLKLEMDLNENETNLIEMEKAVTRLEQRCPRSDNEASRTYPLARVTYEDLLSLLMSADKTAAQCNHIREQIEMYNKQAAEQLAPATVVAKIIDYHNNTLASLEKQIEKMQGQVTQVQREYEQLNRDQESNRAAAQCSCKKTKNSKPIDICKIQLRM
ncbi:uncharacterized protein LOC108044184 [Drosophila rhopaloa]|uniref:Protein MIS12 homolog n=1 Tax=Drosophila rhopaloa TaxID=1041015 RepID=A0ABM5HD73_DRORH|nr:uncharacterized protein LOC108044184 [Drosophila rhopaloa]